MGPQVVVAGRRDGHLLKGIEARFCFELPFKVHATLFEEADVRLTVFQEFFLEIEDVLFMRELSVPLEELGTVFHRHVVRHIIMHRQQGSHVILVVIRIEQMGEVPILSSVSSKVFGNLASFMEKKLMESMNCTL